MSSDDGGPVEWLRAAITERLDLARKAGPGQWEPEGDDPTDDQVIGLSEDDEIDGWTLAHTRGPKSHENMLHVAANDPQDTIARCEAELAILDEHYILTGGDRNPAYEEFSVVPWGAKGGAGDQGSGCVTCHYYGMGGVKGYGICRTVRHLAGGYKRRPGYREEDWKP